MPIRLCLNLMNMRIGKIKIRNILLLMQILGMSEKPIRILIGSKSAPRPLTSS
jgi:hypothetical protein